MLQIFPNQFTLSYTALIIDLGTNQPTLGVPVPVPTPRISGRIFVRDGHGGHNLVPSWIVVAIIIVAVVVVIFIIIIFIIQIGMYHTGRRTRIVVVVAVVGRAVHGRSTIRDLWRW